MLSSQSYSDLDLSKADSSYLQQFPAKYRNWFIRLKTVHGQLWLKWQHPQDKFPRYGCPINQADVVATVNYVCHMIDLSIELESTVK
ncbi:MAG: hypothetical protein WBG70_16700 [Spirulinaceae cyanobacterium]